MNVPKDSIDSMPYVERLFKDRQRTEIPKGYENESICGEVARIVKQQNRYFYYYQTAYERIPKEVLK